MDPNQGAVAAGAAGVAAGDAGAAGGAAQGVAGAAAGAGGNPGNQANLVLANMVACLVACGIDNTPINGNQDEAIATRLASEIFDGNFATAMDKTAKELDDDLKAYANLQANQGQIVLTPAQKRKVKAFLQWCKDTFRTGGDPTVQVFDANLTAFHLQRQKDHESFVKASESMTDTAKPSKFKETDKWEEWRTIFTNFLRCIPGRTGIPLSYVVRPNKDPYNDPNAGMLDDYINRAPLIGEAYETDTSTVHTYIRNFIAGNATAEAKIMNGTYARDGRMDFMRLTDHYEGVGYNSVSIQKADKDINNMQYQGERYPSMYWDLFETRLNKAFDTYDMYEGRQVHSDDMRLRILCNKVHADFLLPTKQVIMVEMNKVPLTMTYNVALAAFRAAVHAKFPPSEARNHRTRRMNEMSRRSGSRGYGGRGGRGRGHGRGRGGRGRGRGGRGRGQSNNNTRARTITATDGHPMEVHASYNFSSQDWARIPKEEKRRLSQERQRYRENQQSMSSNQSLVSELTTTIIGAINARNRDDDQPVGMEETKPHEVPQSIMGGRNEQERLRSMKGAGTPP